MSLGLVTGPEGCVVSVQRAPKVLDHRNFTCVITWGPFCGIEVFRDMHWKYLRS